MAEAATVPQKMTLEEFYAWADRQEEPFELVDGVPVPLYPEPDENGVVRATAAGTAGHHTIQNNACDLLSTRKPAGCRAATGARARAGEEQTRDPDAVHWCGRTGMGAKEVTPGRARRCALA